MTTSPFSVLNLYELRTICEINDVDVDGHMGRRASYLSALEDVEQYSDLRLGTKLRMKLKLTDEQRAHYKVLDTITKRARAKWWEFVDDVEEPPTKRARVAPPTIPSVVIPPTVPVPRSDSIRVSLVPEPRSDGVAELFMLKPNYTIRRIKGLASTLVNSPTSRIRLSFRGLMCSDDATIASCGITDNSDVLVHTVRPRARSTDRRTCRHEPYVCPIPDEELMRRTVGDSEIFVQTLTGKRMHLLVQLSAPVWGVKRLIQKTDYIPADQQRLVYNGQQLKNDRTLADYGVLDQTTMHLVLRLGGGKPVICLYHGDAEPIRIDSVTLRLSEDWRIDTHYPKSPVSDPHTVVWSGISLSGSGGMTFARTKQTFQYLFWDSIATRPARFGFHEEAPIYCMPRSIVADRLAKMLYRLHMRERDVHDCVTFWLPQLESKSYVLLQFMPMEEYEQLVTIDIRPTPPAVWVRVFLLFEPVDTVMAGCAHDFREIDAIPLQEDLGDLAGRYVGYEWGGMNLLGS